MKKFIKQNWFKIGVLFTLVIIALSTFYYFVFLPTQQNQLTSQNENKITETSQPEIAQTTKNDGVKNYFSQNQECLKYKEEIANKLQKKDSPFGKASLEQIFYSPKVDSCVYVEYTEKDDTYSSYNKRLLDIRNDSYSSEPLIMCSAIEGNGDYEKASYGDIAGCDNFNYQLTQYR